MVPESNFMKLHRRNNYQAKKFVELFPETKNANPTDFVFFVSHKGKYGFLSNRFREPEGGHCGEGDIVFPTVEHQLMFEKASLFGDRSSMLAILKATTPAEVKKLGRKVVPFDEAVWNSQRYPILYRAILSKFQDSKELTELLLKTGNKFIVEAASYDKIFGIGLSEYPIDRSRGCKLGNGNFDVPPSEWLDQNLLGITLMEVRSTLVEQISTCPTALHNTKKIM